MKKLNIIIPLYNLGQYLEDCLMSIYNNSTTIDFNVTIVDDCSTDDSYNKAKALIEKVENYDNYKQTKVIQTPKNMHLSYARNYGIQNAEGEYIICIDADDMIPPNYIDENYNTLVKNDVDISYSNSQCFGDNSHLYEWPEYSIEILQHNPYIHCSAMYKKCVWEKSQYDESMKIGWEDYDFWLSAAKNGFKFKKCNNTYLAYRQTNNSMVQDTNKPENQNKIKEYLRTKHPDFYKG